LAVAFRHLAFTMFGQQSYDTTIAILVD
jgi:hypothetical protein